MPSQHWTSALNRFMIMFDDRIRACWTLATN
jgi:hypothetical protein